MSPDAAPPRDHRLEPAAPTHPTHFGERYEVRGVLGRGGMGVVYEAYDRVRATRVALKTMLRLDAATLYRFKNEFRALADVSHPNLAALHELESDGAQTFFTMEYVEGVDFLAYVSGSTIVSGTDSTVTSASTTTDSDAQLGEPVPVRSKRGCDPDRLRRALVQLVDGIAALHRSGKLHRDLKPSNVMVTPEGRVVVLDFGLVSNLPGEGMQTLEHNVVGTPEYMSPEQGAGGELGEASDWYAVGVMLYEALAGELPFRGPAMKTLLDKQHLDPARPSAIARDVPADLEALCLELLLRDPTKRPTASAILARLGGASLPSDVSQRRSVATTMGSIAPAFVGRERHTHALAEAFETARAGRVAIVYVRGSSGMGKSLLIRRYLDELRRRGEAVVLSGRCYERESVPYKALDGIVDALSAHLRKLPRGDVEALLPREIHPLTRLFPVLTRVEAVSGAPRRAHEIPDPQQLRRRAAIALRELVDRMTARRPLVLWIDDLQWGDVDSAPLIEELLRSPEPPPFLLIASYRTEDESAPLVASLRESDARDRQHCDVREIDVGVLDHDEAAGLALTLLGRDEATRAQAEVIATESLGSPFFVDELVRHLSTGEVFRRSSGAVRPRLDEMLHARVRALPADACRLLEIIAVAGGPLSRRAAGDAVELLGERETNALAVLRAGRLVRSHRTDEQYDVETFHDRIRETVVANLSDEQRAAIHLRIAHGLISTGRADPEALVTHFRGAGDPDRAADHAEIAAGRAVDALAFDRAAGLWRTALERPGLAPTARRALVWKLGDALANDGRGAAAAAYLEAADGAAAGDRLELQRRAAEQLLRSGRIAEGMAAIENVLAAVGMTLPKTPWLILASVIFHTVWIRIRGTKFRERDESQLSAEELTRVDICWSVGATLAIVRPVLANIYQKKHMLLALRAGEPKRVARGFAVESTSVAQAGPSARARTELLLAAAHRLADRLCVPDVSAWARGADGMTAYLEGRFRESAAHSDACAEQLRDRCVGAAFEVATMLSFSSWSRFHCGEMRELSLRMPERTQDARRRGDLYMLTTARIGLSNAVWLAADDANRAERELDEAMSQWGSPEQQVQQYQELTSRVHIDLYRGLPEGTLARIEQRWLPLARGHLLRLQVIRVQLLGLRARAAVATAAEMKVGDAAALLDAALADARRVKRERLLWATPLARLIEASVAVQRGDRDAALASLTTAATELDAADMSLWAAAARRRRGEILGGAEGRTMLAAADAKFRAQDVVAPEKFVRILAPGFSSMR